MKIFTIFFLTIFLISCNSEKITGNEVPENEVPENEVPENEVPENEVSFLYDREPNISSCDEGALKDEEKQKALKTINEIRGLHRLKPVTYNYSDDVYTGKSALITVANATLNHHPKVNDQCWSPEGEFGSGKSNLYISSSGSYLSVVEKSENSIIQFLIDDNVDSLGHRRWLIDPFLSFVSYGRVDGKPLVDSKWNMVSGVSLKVINEEKAYIQDLLVDFVAYPFENYPSSYFKHNWYMSFSVLANTSNIWENKNVDYSNAIIEIYDEEGYMLNVHSISHDNTAYGLPNLLKWKVDNTLDNKKYLVKIKNVNVLNHKKNYEYWFKTY